MRKAEIVTIHYANPQQARRLMLKLNSFKLTWRVKVPSMARSRHMNSSGERNGRMRNGRMRKKLISALIIMAMALSITGITATDSASAAGSSYWLKVNRTANVVNVYKNVNGSWKPYKVLLCSCGKNKSGSRTPAGNFSIKKKWRWQRLFHGVSGQYVSQFKGNYLFHSVVYKKYKKGSSCVRSEYNKLGRNASHGCVRLATMDAKWIYENCPRGTKVTVYSSSTPGPLGKPARVAMKGSKKLFWDPTDPSGSNRYFGMTGPRIQIDKPATVDYGEAFDIRRGAKAVNPYTNEDLSSSLKVHSITYCPPGGSSYGPAAGGKVDTTVPGTYRIIYSCYNKYCGRKTVYKTFVLTVNPAPEPAPEPEPEPAMEHEPETAAPETAPV